jgi:hypothetical protein
MPDDFIYVTHHKEKIKSILEKYNTQISDESLMQAMHCCEAYICRENIPKDSVLKDLKKFRSKLNTIENKLSHGALLEINYLLNKFHDELATSIDALDMRKQQKYAYEMLITDLADLYIKVTNKKPGKPYLKDKKCKLYRGPFFEFVNSIITIIKGKEPHSPTLKSTINKVLNSIR